MKQYRDLLKHILENGTHHEDRTGVGTISAFGYQTRFDLREGFPIVTTKKVPFRWVAEELFWFLSGSTDEARLRVRGVDILTLGQYLRPTLNHLAVERWVHPDEFARYREWGLERGFIEVASGPLVRSSYRADRILEKNNLGLSTQPPSTIPIKTL